MSPHPAVLLDSAADIDFIQAEEIGVNLLLQTVEFNGRIWLDAHDLDHQELFTLLRRGTPTPRNTPCSVDAYANTLERLLTRSPHVLALHPQEGQDILQVAQQAAQRFPGRVTVLGSHALSAGLAVQAGWAAQQFREGQSVEAVVKHLQDRMENTQVMVCLQNVEFLHLAGKKTPWLDRIPAQTNVALSTQQDQTRILGFSPQAETTFRIMKQRLRLHARGPTADVAFFHQDAQPQVQALSELATEIGLRVRWAVSCGLVTGSLLGPGAYGFTLMPV